ncbi:MAG: hypothetical protein AAGD35_06880 [Actinomycetota bacterium]
MSLAAALAVTVRLPSPGNTPESVLVWLLAVAVLSYIAVRGLVAFGEKLTKQVWATVVFFGVILLVLLIGRAQESDGADPGAPAAPSGQQANDGG